ncbi:hypothetical protein LCGC14_2923560 [marine sediment metagenome]|uniref:Uncharacterized protein n=1 Tax=marine sediment metagenome TaxID=412755 RepID=A0A0F9AE51_9ZZZZ
MEKQALVALLMLMPACMDSRSPSNSTTLSVSNGTRRTITVYVAFGSDSKIATDDWPFCSGSELSCSFSLTGQRSLPANNYLNATLSFGKPVSCGVTKAEVNINNPSWYDTLDVSLVDGFSNSVKITATPTTGNPVILGPPMSQTGNQKMLGVFPYGCDICVERQNPPCGITKSKTGCKNNATSRRKEKKENNYRYKAINSK